MSYPSNLDTFTTKVDGVDDYLAAHMNAVQAAIVAVETEIGLGLRGTLTDLAARLAVGLNNDGTLKNSALSSLAANTVDMAAIQALAVTAAKIANGAVGTTQIANNAVTAAQIANGAIGALQIASGAVGTTQIASQAITNALIASGAVLPDNLGLTVWNATGSTLTAGQLVYESGWNVANSLPQVSLSVNNVTGADAVYIVTASISNGASGTVRRHWTSGANLNTNGSTVGNPAYLDSVAGGWTLTAPTSPNSTQVVGRVTVVSATVGQIEFDLISNGYPHGGAGGGNATSATAFGSEPGSPATGDLDFYTNAPSIARWDGSAWKRWGKVGEWTNTPSAASLTALNVTTATIADSAGGLWVNAPNISAAHLEGWYKSLAGGAYTWIVRLDPLLLSTTFTAAGLFLRDSVGGKIISFEQAIFGSGNLGINVVQWSDANTRFANAFATGGLCQLFPWFKITDDGTTNRTYSLSQDGVNWVDIFTEGRTTYLGVAPDQAGVFACANGATVGLNVHSWSGV